MDKASEMGRISAVGSLHLFIGKAISTVIMAVGTIILGNLMLEKEYGLYAVALIPPLMINLFQDWGISAAMTKYIAQNRATNKEENIHSIITAGLVFKIATGATLSITSLFLANYIATTIFNRPEATTLMAIASITILSDSLLTASQSNFNGFEKMELNSLTMICQSIIKTTASPLLVLAGYGALGAVLGHTFSLLIAGIMGLAMLYFLLFRKLPRKQNPHKPNTIKSLKTMLHFGVPLSISTILGGFLIQFYAFMMAFYCELPMIGNYQIAVNFAVLLTFFTFPIATVLLPAFSKLDAKNEPQLLQTVFSSSIKYTAMLLVPATMTVMVLSEPMVSTLFGQKWIYAPFFLTLYVITNLLVLFGSLVVGSFLTGTGETKMLLKLTLLTLSIGTPLAIILIPTLGITGVILGPLIAGIPSLFWSLYWIWKHYDAKTDYKSSAKILAASVAAAAITYLSLNLFIAAEWIELLIGLIIFLAVYLSTAPIIGAITTTDINGLRAMLSNLGTIFTIINIPLTITEKVATWAPKLKAKIISVLELLYRTRKTILLLLIVSLATITIGSIISVLLSKTYKIHFPTLGNIYTIGVQAYSDSNLQNLTTEIQWGTIYPGNQRSVTLYLRSTGNVNTTLEKKEANWTFRNSTNMIVSGPNNTIPYMSLTWDYDNSTITPREIVEISLVLEVENSPEFIQFIIDNDVNQFSFDITISAIEET